MAFFGLEAEEYDRKYKDLNLFKRIMSYFRPFYRGMIIVIVFLSLYSFSNALIPILSREIIIYLETTRNPIFLIIMISTIFILNVLGFVFNYFRQRYGAIVIGGVVLNLRQDANEAVMNRDLSFFDRNPTGKIVSRINTDSRDFGDAINLFMEFFSSILVLVLIGSFMVLVNILLFLLFLIILPIFFVIALLFRRLARHLTLLSQRSLAQVNAFVQESISGIQIAKTFRREKKLYKEFQDINNQCYRVNFRRALAFNFIFPTLFLVQGVILTSVTFFGGIQILNGQINAGDLYLFLQSLWLLVFPILTIASFWTMFQTGLAAAERIFSIIDTPAAIVQHDNKSPGRVKGELTFEKVTFGYEENKKVLDHFSLKIRPGESLAIVGQTGAGKSTIAKLLIRFYEFQEGDILIDGTSIRDFDLSAYRKIIGFIPQTPFLWGESVEGNVKYGNPEATNEEIMWALNQAGGADWTDGLSNGLKTNVGERGNLLSVGQRQLVAFARVLLENPAIFVLDEATASVDPFTETRIQDALEKVMEGRTSIIIAHRLWTVRRVDRIVVLDDGKIVEEGNHDQLMAKCGVYANLYNTYFRHQSLEYIDEIGKMQERRA